MRLGEVSLDVALNRTSVNNAINELRSSIKDVSIQLNPQVDHRPLTELNQHLDAKVKHVRQVNGFFALNPITPQVDTRQLKHLDNLTKLINNQRNNEIKILLKNDIQVANTRQQTRELITALKQVEKQVQKSKPNALLFGIQQGLGNEIAKGINKQVKDSFGFKIGGLGKVATKAIAKPTNFLFRDNEGFDNYLGGKVKKTQDSLRNFFFKIGEAASEALETEITPESGLKNKQSVFVNNLKNKFKTVAPPTAQQSTPLTDDLDLNFVKGNKGKYAQIQKQIETGFRKASKAASKELELFGKAVFNPDKLLEITEPIGEQFVNQYRIPSLKQKAIPLVNQRLQEMALKKSAKDSPQIIDDETKELFLTIGGFAGQKVKGVSGKRIAADLRKQNLPGAKAMAVMGVDTDIDAQMVNEGRTREAIQQVIGKHVARGYNKDAVEIAAQAIAAIQKKPDLQVKMLGESGGGFAVAEAKQILDMMGYGDNAQYLGVGTPNMIGGFKTQPDNFIISPDEYLGRDTHKTYKNLGLANVNHPKQNILGVYDHTYENYQAAQVPEYNQFIKGSPEQIKPERLGSLKSFADTLQGLSKDDFFDEGEIVVYLQSIQKDFNEVRSQLLISNNQFKDELEVLAATYENAILNLADEPGQLGVLKTNIQSAIKKYKSAKTPIEANTAKREILEYEKELNTLFANSIGTIKAKKDLILKEVKEAFTPKPVTIPLNFPAVAEPVMVINAQKERLTARQNLAAKIQTPLTEFKPAVQNTANVNEQDVKSKIESAKNITKQFQTVYKEIKQLTATDIGTATQRTVVVLSNISRAKQDIKTLKGELGVDAKMGTDTGNKLNQSLGQLTQLEKNIKRAFAKVKSPDAEIQKLVREIVNGIDESIGGSNTKLENIAANIPQTIIKSTEEGFEIKSPSRVFIRIGKQVVDGFEKGLSAIKNITFFEDLRKQSLKAVNQKGIFDVLKEQVGSFVNVAASLFSLDKAFSFIGDYSPVFKETALDFERLSIGLENVSGSSAAAETGFTKLRQQASQLGLELKSTVEGYNQLSTATKDTPLEGYATEQIFKGVQEASIVRQLSQDQISGTNLAIQQIASKGVVQQEELRGQLGERLIGATQVAARSRGQSVQELNKDIRKGTVTSEEFLPAFAQQLSAESAISLPKALDSSVAVTNRFNNAVAELQATLGKPILNIEKTGLKLLTPVLENLNVVIPLVSNFILYLSTTTLIKFLPVIKSAAIAVFDLVTGMNFGVSALKTLGTTVVSTSLKFAAFVAVVEVFKAISTAIQDASGDLKDFADVSKNGLNNYRDILKEDKNEKVESRFKTAQLPRSFINQGLEKLGILKPVSPVLVDQSGNQKLKESAIGQGLLGFLPDTLEKDAGVLKKIGFSFRASIQDLEGVFGNYSEKAKNDRIKSLGELKKASGETNLEVNKILTNGNSPVSQVQGIDAKLQALQLKRRGITLTNPEDVQTLKQIKTEEEQLLKQREQAAKSISVLQAQNASTIEAIKKAITEAERLALIPSEYQAEYRQQADKLADSLKEAENAQEQLNRAIKKGVNEFTLFIDRANSIVDILADNRAISGVTATGFKTQINQLQATGQYTPEQAASITQQVDIQATVNELGLVTRSIRELSQLIAERGEVLSTYGVQPSTGVGQLQRLSEQIENPNDKAVIDKFIELKQLQTQSSELTNQVSQQQAAFAQTLRDTAKEVADFYKELSSQSAQLIEETKNIQNTIALNTAKGKLKTALLGQQESFVNSYVEGLTGILESLNQPLQQALQAQQQMLGNYQSAIGQQTNLQGLQNRQALVLNNQLSFGQSQGMSQGETGFISGSSGVMKPVSNAPITSQYGMRTHPVTGKRTMHGGTDFGARTGTPVIAPTSAKVTAVDNNASGAEGKMLTIQSIDSAGRKIEQLFMHLSKINVSVGQTLKQGEKIAEVGNTGRSTGAHLHYTVKINGQSVNPTEFLNSKVGIPASGNSNNNSATGFTKSTPSSRSGGGKYAHTQDKLTDQFLRGTAQAAQKLGTKPEYLLAVMGFETGGTYSPKKTNSLGYTGLIQFSPKYSPGNVGKSTSQLRGMTQMEQLQYVPKYIDKNRNGKDVSSLEDLYMSVLMPILIGKGNNAKLPGWAYSSNKGLDANRDGAISVSESASKVKDYLPNAGVMQRLYGKNPITEFDRKRQMQAQQSQAQSQLTSQPETGFTNQPLDLSSLNLNQKEIEKANALIITNYTTQNANIKAQLDSANQLSQLETQLQRQSVSNSFEKSLADVEENIANTQRRIKDMGTGEADTPAKRRQQEILQTNREFFDLNKGLVKQGTELESAFSTLSATKAVIQKGGFQGADALQSELPAINDGLIRLQRAIKITETGFTDSEKARMNKLAEIDKKYEKARQDTARQVSTEARRNEIQRLRKEADIVEQQLGGNIGGKARGDVNSLRKNASELEILLNLDEGIQQLQALQNAGERTEEQTKKLRGQLEGLASQDIEANNIKYQTELRNKLLAIEERELAITQRKTGFEKSIAETLAGNADFKLNLDVTDLSSGDPVTLRYQANVIALQDELKQLTLDARRFAESQGLSAEETDNLINEIAIVNKLKADTLDAEYAINLERAKQERGFRVREKNLAISNRFSAIDSEQSDIDFRNAELSLQKNPFDFSKGNPIDIKFKSSIESTRESLERLKLETQQFAYAQNLTSQETEILIQQLESLNLQQQESLRTEYELNKEAQQREIKANERSKNEFKNSNFTNLLGAGIESYSMFGRTTEAAKLQKEIASIQLKDEFTNNSAALEEFARTSGLSNEEVDNLRTNLERLNEIKLDNLEKQFTPWTEVMRSGVEGLQQGIGGLIDGTMSLGDAFNTIGLSISNTLTKLAAEFVTNEIISGIFGRKQFTTGFNNNSGGIGGFLGGVFGSGGADNGIGGFVGQILGFASGGTVPANGGIETGFTSMVGSALRKEGANAVLATLTPGEQVLNLKEAELYRKVFPQGIAKIYQYSDGGVVGGIEPTSTKMNKQSETGFTINVPVNVEGGSGVDGNKLGFVIKAAVVSEIRKQQNPGGLLSS